MDNAKRVLSDCEKPLVAMGAAIGGGCGKCAENLIRIAREQGVTSADIEAACRAGFAAKAEAAKTMRAKVAAILKAGSPENGVNGEGADMRKLASLIRTAAFAAANSAPDAVKEMKKACLQGATEGDFRMCLSMAKSIRKKAEQFSDGDISEDTGSGTNVELKTNNKTDNACACGCN